MKGMILIADSGSTKTDWRLIDKKNNRHQFQTIGFNPFFQDTETIASEIKNKLVAPIHALESEEGTELEIYFYGAGCSSIEKCNIVKAAIQEAFPKASVFVDHDLLAAARALCGTGEGLAAIMGTGSNSCYYDGNRIVSNVSSLGYILGDEGSGAYIGKHFIQDYLNNELPAVIADHFNSTYQLNKETILNAVYRQPMPSRFLASFSKFINQHRDHEYFRDLVTYNFEQFFTKHICKYENHRNVALSCVGSVAFHYSDTLRKVAESKGVRLNKVLETPIVELTSYHIQQ